MSTKNSSSQSASSELCHQKFVNRLAQIYLQKKTKDPVKAAEWANRSVPFTLVPRVKEAMRRPVR
jgi:hypothetical protein